jgi:peptidyl-prolyl cis-trans isomerase B (cyclophilin B)
VLKIISLTVLFILLSSLTACGGTDDIPDTASEQSTTAATPPTEPESKPASGETVACDYVDAEPVEKKVEKPSRDAPSAGTTSLTIATSIGDLNVTLDSDAAPCAVHSFVSLAKQGYFDDTTCHRLTMPGSGISVLQCGDPTASGSGGPGYSFADEVTGQEQYAAGTLAMANAGPDTNGSQFFVVYGATQLPPSYTIFGTIEKASLTLVAEAAAQGTTTGEIDGPPKVPVDITSVS